MEDRSAEVLKYYDIETFSSKKGRGGIILATKNGYVLVKEYNGTRKRMDYEEELLLKINETNLIFTDNPLRNIDGNLITELEDGTKYIVKKWYSGRECEVKNMEDILKGTDILATLHCIMGEIKLNEKPPSGGNSLYEEYEKHNIELKRARNFIRNKSKKNSFELDILKNFNSFFEMSVEAARKIEAAQMMAKEENYGITHGNYNYHNIILGDEKNSVINFDSSRFQLQVLDLYNYLRKVMEKYNWDEKVGLSILEIYDKKRNISVSEKELLRALISYPEKYWKVINRYLNSPKTFVPDKSCEKMEKVYEMMGPKSSFVLKI